MPELLWRGGSCSTRPRSSRTSSKTSAISSVLLFTAGLMAAPRFLYARARGKRRRKLSVVRAPISSRLMPCSRAAEARAVPLAAENLQAIVPGFSAVDDDRELSGAGALELPAKNCLLDVAGGGVVVVVQPGLD